MSTNPSYTGARPELLELMREPWERALDVGCAEGAVGAALKDSNPRGEVTGIELDAAMAATARTRLDDVLEVDAQTALDDLAATGRTFELVCCGDVLEHLVDPWSALRSIRRLCPRGRVVVSLPNVGHWTTLWSVAVLGVWPYRDRGIHDRTHLRFFARNNLADLFARSGFALREVRRVHRLFETPGKLSRVLGRWLGWLPLLGRFTTYQFLCVAEPREPFE
ncbi:MAG: class I SAM-dependent methyltransferase [Planctomycetes bacterium]|nr:class I SAM-dependent methyltransferase [Planctomycetota bacterium]